MSRFDEGLRLHYERKMRRGGISRRHHSWLESEVSGLNDKIGDR